MPFETNHPLFVSAENTQLEGCDQNSNCRLWGSGLLRFANRSNEEKFSAQIIMTMAGCETCDGPYVRQSDLRVIDSAEGPLLDDREHSVAWVQEQAEQKLAEVVQALASVQED